MAKTTFTVTFEDGVSKSVTANIRKPKIKLGYWGDMNGKRIKKLYFGETVYYFIETEDFLDDSEVTLKIFEKDAPPYSDNLLNQDIYSIKIIGNKGKVAFKIKESWLNLEKKNEISRKLESNSQLKEEIILYAELSSKKITQKFRDTIIYLLYPLEDLTLKDGGGNVEHQRFTVKVKGTKVDYEKFKNTFTSSPEKITNNLLATYVPFDKNNDGKFSVGDQIDIDIKGPDNGSVRVANLIINDNSFEVYFHALEGHTDAGNIRFSGKFIENHFNSSDSLVEFEIYNITRLNVAFGIVGRIIIGGHLSRINQKRQWKNVLANFCNFFNKKAYIATSHTITYNWNSEKESLGSLKKNKTKIITQKVNSYKTKPLDFGVTENKLW
ncbi:hypothetical protein OAT18_03805 [Tenacibaculum sp.]|nr:hypothetical protein [Tenacibaculum sp.]